VLLEGSRQLRLFQDPGGYMLRRPSALDRDDTTTAHLATSLTSHVLARYKLCDGPLRVDLFVSIYPTDILRARLVKPNLIEIYDSSHLDSFVQS
jgi:hypothetical protein